MFSLHVLLRMCCGSREMVRGQQPELVPVARTELSLVLLPLLTHRSSGHISLLEANCHWGNLRGEFVIGSWVWAEKGAGLYF